MACSKLLTLDITLDPNTPEEIKDLFAQNISLRTTIWKKWNLPHGP